jgi:hypothetical protein
MSPVRWPLSERVSFRNYRAKRRVNCAFCVKQAVFGESGLAAGAQADALPPLEEGTDDP